MMFEKKIVLNMFSIVFVLFPGLFISAQNSSSAELITIEKALETAMFNSPNIKRTELDLQQSRERLTAQEASLKSQFSLRFNPFSYSRDRTFNNFFNTWNTNKSKESNSTFTISQPIKQTDGTLSLINRLSWQDSYSEFQDFRSKSYNNNLYISYEHPLFTYNRTKLELRELELDMENTLYAYTIQKLSLEQQVTQEFYDLYQRKMALEIAHEELANQEQSYEIIKNKVDAGLAAKEEFYQAELNLANSELAVQNRQESLDNALDTFKLLIGMSIYEQVDIQADVIHQTVKVNLEKAVNNGLKNRLELHQHEISIQNAVNNLTRTAALNEFKGSVTLSYGLIGNDEQFDAIYDSPTKKQAVGITFDIPLWDWGENESRIKASQAGIQKQRLSLEDERNTIILRIRQAHRNLEKLVNQIEIANKNIRNAQLTYEINLERYKNGDLTSMDLNLHQNQLSNAKMGLIQAVINYKLALLNMKILSLWDFEKDRAVLPESILE